MHVSLTIGLRGSKRPPCLFETEEVTQKLIPEAAASPQGLSGSVGAGASPCHRVGHILLDQIQFGDTGG
jgi:hypothetical protein